MVGRYEWSSAHVLVPLILGAVMLSGFIVWQGYAPYPMFPRRLRQDPRTLGLTLVITFISGANFFSILVRDRESDVCRELLLIHRSQMFWPTQAFNVYGHDPVSTSSLQYLLLVLTGVVGWSRRQGYAEWLRHPWWRCRCSVAALSFPWPQQGAHDRIVHFDDSRLWRSRCWKGGQPACALGASGPCWIRHWWYRRAGFYHQ